MIDRPTRYKSLKKHAHLLYFRPGKCLGFVLSPPTVLSLEKDVRLLPSKVCYNTLLGIVLFRIWSRCDRCWSCTSNWMKSNVECPYEWYRHDSWYSFTSKNNDWIVTDLKAKVSIQREVFTCRSFYWFTCLAYSTESFTEYCLLIRRILRRLFLTRDFFATLYHTLMS